MYGIVQQKDFIRDNFRLWRPFTSEFGIIRFICYISYMMKTMNQVIKYLEPYTNMQGNVCGKLAYTSRHGSYFIVQLDRGDAFPNVRTKGIITAHLRESGFVYDHIKDSFSRNIEREKFFPKVISYKSYDKDLAASIREYKRTENLKKSNTIVDLREITETYNIIYYLYVNDVITYIGQSKNVNDFTRLRRIMEHYKNGKKFDKYHIRNVSLDYDIDAIEAFEIITHKPIENKSINMQHHEIRHLMERMNGYFSMTDERYLYEMSMKRAGLEKDISPIRYL